MHLIDAQVHFDTATAYLEGSTRDGQPHPVDVNKAENILNEILNYNLGNILVLYALGSVQLRKGYHGFAIETLQRVVATEPTFGEAWNNLGLAYKEIPDFAKAEFCMARAVKFMRPEYVGDIYCNMAALNIGRNLPEQCLKWCEKALELNPQSEKARWHKALALLEMRKWDEAWDYHDSRLTGGSPGEIGERNYHAPDGHTPLWDGKSPGTVVIHGEQGIGDEIMFASCIPDALKVAGCNFIIEPSPRLETLFARSFPQAKVYGTDDMHGERWINDLGKPDYKIALGSLPRLFRRAASAFPGTSYLVPDRGKRAWWGEKLTYLGRKPNIGIAWQGGVAKTRYDARSFHPSAYEHLFRSVDANWISLQYDSTAQLCVDEVKEKLDVRITHWPKAVSQKDPDTGKLSNIDELVALISRLDLVVTVCQTAVHIAGALGVPVFCLTPSDPSWRYSAGEATDMPWYRSVRQFRQERGSTDWAPVIERVTQEVQQFISIQKAAKWA